MKYKVGDKVKIKTWEEMGKEYDFPSLHGEVIQVGYYGFHEGMENWINENFSDRILTIFDIGSDFYIMKSDWSCWSWSDKMIECLAKDDKVFIPILNRFEILDL